MGKDFIQGFTSDVTGNTITEPNKKIVLSLHYNGSNSYLFVNGREELQFTAQSFTNNIKSQVFCIGNISNDWNLSGMSL